MAVEDRYINANKRTTIDNGNIEIFIFYEEPDLLQLEFFVSNQDTIREGISITAGDLAYTYQNITALFEIDNNGDLIVNDIDPTKYSIDAAGDIIYTTT